MPNKPETVFCGETPVRTFAVNGRTKFAARDLCGIIGYPAPHKMLASAHSRPEYIDAMTPGGTQKLRVAEREDIEKVLSHCRHRNAGKLRNWLRKGVKAAVKAETEKPKAASGKDDNVLLVFMFD